MSTKGVADVVFCLDASGSMGPCIEAVKRHITAFIDGLGSQGQTHWDLRFDFVAHDHGSFECSSVRLESAHESDVVPVLYKGRQGRLFTDVAGFKNGLARISTGSDETSLIALDCCLDFPWRSGCHRVVILITDEPFETGGCQPEQAAQLPHLIQKIQQLKVMLYLIGPESTMFDRLAAVDRSEYRVVDTHGDGLHTIDFAEVFGYIGRSVSVSNVQSPSSAKVTRGLFGQAGWNRP